jgi:hypothetical protein
MPRARLLSILLLSVVTTTGLLVAEGVIRHLHPEATRALQLTRINSHRLVWQRPDPEFHHSGDGVFRLVFPEPAGGVPRVMIVGDSFAVGYGVDETVRFGALVDQVLDEDVDVLAVPSYAPVIYRNVVRRALSRAEYSVVAVFVDQTDPVDNLIYQNELVEGSAAGEFDLVLMTEREQLFRETLDRVEAEFHGLRGVPRRSAIVNLVLPVRILDAIPAGSPHYEYIRLSLARWSLVRTFQEEPDSRVTEAMETLLFHYLDQLVGLCRSRGVEVVLAANPWEFQVVTGGDNRLERLLLDRYSGADGVTVMELTAAFAAHPTPSQLFLPDGDIHWNEKGHALVAERLADALVSLD